MLRLVIVEDEKPALKNLKLELQETGISHQVIREIGTVEEGILWLNNNPPPFDLLLMDISLPDGLSFTICSDTKINVPVIFITAYDQYYTEAFESNGIDYILKPIDTAQLRKAISKYINMKDHFLKIERLLEYFNLNNKKNKIIVKRGEEYACINMSKIVYFFCENRVVYLVDADNKKYITEYSNLVDIEPFLSQDDFFKANRKYIVNMNQLRKFRKIDKSRIQLELSVPTPNPIVISQGNTQIFKQIIRSI